MLRACGVALLVAVPSAVLAQATAPTTGEPAAAVPAR
jgi:hypothetical protein